MVETKIHARVLEIVVNNPPVNALGAAVRQGLVAAIAAAQTDAGVKAIVIRGAGRLFCAGADITEFDKPIVLPMLPQVIDAIEASAKPVIAAIHGMALGGGLEIALGCHYRLATRSAKLGLPEVKLGILPGAGGTQRLPRLAGIEPSLDMIVSGDPITAEKGLSIGLIDQLVDDKTLAEEALSYAKAVKNVRRTGDLRCAADAATFERFAAANARKIKGLEAPAACIEAVQAATRLPLVEGQALEGALFMKLVRGDQSKALRHLFFAERAAANVEGLTKDVQRRPVQTVGIVGAGTMGGGIAMSFLSSGIRVILLDMKQEALDRGVQTIRKNYEASAAKGKIAPDKVEAAMSLLDPTLDLERLRDCDLLIEAVYEDMELKKSTFARLDQIARPGAILASNTSYLSIDEIALATSRPQEVVGLHFFSPAHVMKLVEVVRGAKTVPDVLATGMHIARRIGKVPVVAGVCYGFIGNRMLIPRYEQAFKLLNEGALPEQVDRVNTDFGMPMGPFQMADLSGTDLGWHRDPTRIDSLRDALCAKGRWGQKTQAGFYDYNARREPQTSPVVADIISQFRQQSGVSPRKIEDEEILVRTLYTVINEGAIIVEEGIAQRASDVDVVWVFGYGWPRHKGGPLFWADHLGARTIVDALKKYRKELGPDFVIAPWLLRSAAENVPLADLRS